MRLFPAGAGVILVLPPAGKTGRAVPRRGGGDPNTVLDNYGMAVCSPQGLG